MLANILDRGIGWANDEYVSMYRNSVRTYLEEFGCFRWYGFRGLVGKYRAHTLLRRGCLQVGGIFIGYEQFVMCSGGIFGKLWIINQYRGKRFVPISLIMY